MRSAFHGPSVRPPEKRYRSVLDSAPSSRSGYGSGNGNTPKRRSSPPPRGSEPTDSCSRTRPTGVPVVNRRRFYPRKRPGRSAFTCKQLLTANVRRGTRNGRSPLSGPCSFEIFRVISYRVFLICFFFRRDHGSIFPRSDAARTVLCTTRLVDKLNVCK